MAAPLKLTPAAIQRMEQAVLLAAHKKQVAAYMGVTYETLRAWLARGQAEAERCQMQEAEPSPDEALYLDLYERFDSARGKAAIALLTKIQAATPRDWRAAIALLERTFPGEYGRAQALKLSADDETMRNIVKVVRGIDVDAV